MINVGRKVIAVALVVTICALGSVRAPLADDSDNPDNKELRRATALEAYRRGKDFYTQGSFEEAVEAFQAAYALDPVPALLFNIGQAQRRGDDCIGALQSYKAFLGGAQNHSAAEDARGHVLELEHACGDAESLASPLVKGSQEPEGVALGVLQAQRDSEALKKLPETHPRQESLPRGLKLPEARKQALPEKRNPVLLPLAAMGLSASLAILTAGLAWHSSESFDHWKRQDAELQSSSVITSETIQRQNRNDERLTDARLSGTAAAMTGLTTLATAVVAVFLWRRCCALNSYSLNKAQLSAE